MDEDVGLAAVGHNEAIALADIEPFDAAGHFDEANRALDILGRTTDGFSEDGWLGFLVLVAQRLGPLVHAARGW